MYMYIYIPLYESWTMETYCSAMTRTPPTILKLGYGFFLGLPHLKVNEILMRIDEKEVL